ncbi:alpha-E domain-containing protein [Luteimonas sp. 3794]|uniref:alpha-E domain-containing protein n=1 Tax=Luteimonas sp. 3794 TaxID=2817730 RepID=UPI0028544687|nr:alpha-E domain-containing protein [Luteimonas sp. 3794]MDR6991591.1 putative alpha-E superfamily protein [Luteimonas sp. 3794]
MLCRTANDLYWVARNMERAENTARLLDMAQRIALLPERLDRGKAQAAPWRRALDSLGSAQEFEQAHGRIDAESVVQHLLLSPTNPGSIYSCLRAARENARAQRVAITAEMYEDLNSSWLEIRRFDSARLRQDGLSSALEWVKTRSAAFRGITIGTLGRGEGYQFLQMGAFIERADWSIRLLDMISSDETLPETGEARDATQYFQWSALLQALSAFETYRRLYRESVSPAGVAALMLLNDDNPRSLQTCVGAIHQILQQLSGGESLEVARQAGALAAQARYAHIDEIIAGGLESWLQDTMARLSKLGSEIHRQFMTTGAAPVPPPVLRQSQWQRTS